MPAICAGMFSLFDARPEAEAATDIQRQRASARANNQRSTIRNNHCAGKNDP